MRSSKYVKVDKDVLLEYIYVDDNYLTEDYRIIYDTLRNVKSFSNTDIENKTENQLFCLEPKNNKWGVVDYTENNKYYNLQFQTFSGNVPFNYNIIRLHFPINYTFKDKLGFLLNIGLYNQSQNTIYYLSNYFYDKSIVERNDMQYTSPPFLFQEKLWGKYIEIEIPSPIELIKSVNIQNGVKYPKTGTIQKNLIGSSTDVFSSETPIMIDFQFLTKNETKLDKEYYFVTNSFSVTLPTVPEYEQLSLTIEHHSDNDYFEIYGTYGNIRSEFETFINTQNKLGKSYYVTFDILMYEKNIQTSSSTYLIMENFDKAIEYRPIIKYSTTTALIDVTMKLINAIDDTVIIRKSNYAMLQDQVAKYSKKLTKINVANTYKPKIYNNKASNISINYKGNTIKEKIETTTPVMYDRYNVNVKNISDTVNDTTYYGLGLGQIILYPSDNILKFAIANGKNETGYVPFSVPESASLFLQFKDNDSIVEVPIYYDSSEVNYSNGIVVFLVNETYYKTIKKISENGYDQYYIVMKNKDNITSVIYAGRFLTYN